MKTIVIENGKVKWHQRIRSNFQFGANKIKNWWKRGGMLKTMFYTSYAIGIVANVFYIRWLNKK